MFIPKKHLIQHRELFKNANRNPSVENIALAKNILDTINQGQFNHLHEILPRVQSLISIDDYDIGESNKVSLINMIQMIEKSNYNQQQIEQLKKTFYMNNIPHLAAE